MPPEFQTRSGRTSFIDNSPFFWESGLDVHDYEDDSEGDESEFQKMVRISEFHHSRAATGGGEDGECLGSLEGKGKKRARVDPLLLSAIFLFIRHQCSPRVHLFCLVFFFLAEARYVFEGGG